mmetsp:Transcript_146632/g.470499  ORF Transcript_146632/g.470499 Transcript_146632/m.470499 type:complete len:266 (+) Transcript_146632:108-905(+)
MIVAATGKSCEPSSASPSVASPAASPSFAPSVEEIFFLPRAFGFLVFAPFALPCCCGAPSPSLASSAPSPCPSSRCAFFESFGRCFFSSPLAFGLERPMAPAWRVALHCVNTFTSRICFSSKLWINFFIVSFMASSRRVWSSSRAMICSRSISTVSRRLAYQSSRFSMTSVRLSVFKFSNKKSTRLAAALKSYSSSEPLSSSSSTFWDSSSPPLMSLSWEPPSELEDSPSPFSLMALASCLLALASAFFSTGDIWNTLCFACEVL